MFIWESGTFLFSQLFTLMAGTWSGGESECFRNPDFCPKIHFLWEPVFFQKNIGGHGHMLCIGVGPVPKSFFLFRI